MKRWRHLLVAIAAVPAIASRGFLYVLADYATGLHWLLDSLLSCRWPGMALSGRLCCQLARPP